jgi:MFS family permease
MVMLFGVVASASVTNFFPTVVATLGYGKITSLLLTAPPYVLCVITAYLNAWHADRTGERYLHVTIPLWFAMIAFIIAASTTALAPRYLSMMLMVPGCYTSFVIILAWISNTMPRPPAKRAAALAFINAVSNSSSIYASYMYPESAGPRYIVAMSVNCATCFVAILMATLLRFILVRLNRKLDEGMAIDVNPSAMATGAQTTAQYGLPAEGAKRGFRYRV